MAAGGVSPWTLFVRRIPWTVAKEEIKTYFSQFGEVKKCVMPFLPNLDKEVTCINNSYKADICKDRGTGFYKGMCWVSFFQEKSLINALEKNSHILDGVKVHAEKAKEATRGQKIDDIS